MCGRPALVHQREALAQQRRDQRIVIGVRMFQRTRQLLSQPVLPDHYHRRTIMETDCAHRRDLHVPRNDMHQPPCLGYVGATLNRRHRVAVRPPTRYRATLRCPCGEIGRRIRLKIERRKACWFESGQGHHSLESRTVEDGAGHLMVTRERARWLGLDLLENVALMFGLQRSGAASWSSTWRSNGALSGAG